MKVKAIIKIARIEGADKATIDYFNKNVFKREDEGGKEFNIFCVESIADDLAGGYLPLPVNWILREIKEVCLRAKADGCDWVEFVDQNWE